jgi:hypothetical protein
MKHYPVSMAISLFTQNIDYKKWENQMVKVIFVKMI